MKTYSAPDDFLLVDKRNGDYTKQYSFNIIGDLELWETIAGTQISMMKYYEKCLYIGKEDSTNVKMYAGQIGESKSGLFYWIRWCNTHSKYIAQIIGTEKTCDIKAVLERGFTIVGNVWQDKFKERLKCGK